MQFRYNKLSKHVYYEAKPSVFSLIFTAKMILYFVFFFNLKELVFLLLPCTCLVQTRYQFIQVVWVSYSAE